MAQALGGTVARTGRREYGATDLTVGAIARATLLQDLPDAVCGCG